MNRYLLCAALAGFVIALSLLFQGPITYNNGLGWDGSHYAQLASQCGRERLQALEPFTYRIGVPCIAALIPADPRLGLQVVNVAAAVLLLFLLDAWLRRHLSSRVAVVLLAAFAFHWVAPLRQVWWYPTYIDPGALCAIVGALLASRRPGGNSFALICFFGSLIRETTIIVPLSVLFGAMITSTVDVRTALAGLFASATAIVLTHGVATPTSDYWLADAAFYWAYNKPLPTYLLAIFITYGPALALLAVGWPAVKAHLLKFPDHAVMLALVLVLAWIGGSDTERFLIWGAPIVLVLIGKAAEQVEWSRAKGAAVVLLTGHILNGRWLLPIPPDFVEAPARVWPVLTPLSATSYLLLYSQTPDRVMGAVALAEYLALSAAIAAWLIWRSRPDSRRLAP